MFKRIALITLCLALSAPAKALDKDTIAGAAAIVLYKNICVNLGFPKPNPVMEFLLTEGLKIQGIDVNNLTDEQKLLVTAKIAYEMAQAAQGTRPPLCPEIRSILAP